MKLLNEDNANYHQTTMELFAKNSQLVGLYYILLSISCEHTFSPYWSPFTSSFIYWENMIKHKLICLNGQFLLFCFCPACLIDMKLSI